MSIDELGLAKKGFISAHGRFLEAHSNNDVDLWFAALSETIWWIAALDDYYAAHFGSYELIRDHSDYGGVIPGLKLARHKAIHELMLLVDYGYALRKNKSGVVNISQLHWRATLVGVQDVRSKKQRLSFESKLAGQAVRYSLRRVNQFFIRQRDGLDEALGIEKFGT